MATSAEDLLMSGVSLLHPRDFFREQVCSATAELRIELEEHLEFYLVNLLCEFINPAQLQIDENMDVLDTPLALMLKKALESTPDTQIKVYKRLGDTSLYVAGYFQDFFNRRTYDADYYIAMGAAAYEKTSLLMRTHRNDPNFASIYACLSQDFRKLVTIIGLVAETISPAQPRDLISTFVRWQQAPSEKLRKALEEQGVPLPLIQPKDTSS